MKDKIFCHLLSPYRSMEGACEGKAGRPLQASGDSRRKVTVRGAGDWQTASSEAPSLRQEDTWQSVCHMPVSPPRSHSHASWHGPIYGLSIRQGYKG